MNEVLGMMCLTDNHQLEMVLAMSNDYFGDALDILVQLEHDLDIKRPY